MLGNIEETDARSLRSLLIPGFPPWDSQDLKTKLVLRSNLSSAFSSENRRLKIELARRNMEEMHICSCGLVLKIRRKNDAARQIFIYILKS